MPDAPPSPYTPPYTGCTLITPAGRVVRNKSVRASKLMSVQKALEALRGDHNAWVAPGDEEKILQELAGMV